jgi:hypothetical protein
LHTFRHDLPAGLEQIVARCLERDVTKRIQSCEELRDLLAPFENDESVAPLSSAGARVESAVRRRVDPRLNETAPTARETAAPSPAPMQSGVRVPQRAPGFGLAVATLTTMAIAAVVWLSARPLAPEAPSTHVAPEILEPAAPVLAPRPSAAPAPSRVTFVISPLEARVSIDGRPVTPDTRGELAMPVRIDDRGVHELRVEARGFRTRIEDLRLSYPARIVVVLEPGTGRDDRRAGHASPPHRSRVTPTTEPAPPPLLTPRD